MCDEEEAEKVELLAGWLKFRVTEPCQRRQGQMLTAARLPSH